MIFPEFFTIDFSMKIWVFQKSGKFPDFRKLCLNQIVSFSKMRKDFYVNIFCSHGTCPYSKMFACGGLNFSQTASNVKNRSTFSQMRGISRSRTRNKISIAPGLRKKYKQEFNRQNINSFFV